MNIINKTSGTILINGKEFTKDDLETKPVKKKKTTKKKREDK